MQQKIDTVRNHWKLKKKSTQNALGVQVKLGGGNRQKLVLEALLAEHENSTKSAEAAGSPSV